MPTFSSTVDHIDKTFGLPVIVEDLPVRITPKVPFAAGTNVEDTSSDIEGNTDADVGVDLFKQNPWLFLSFGFAVGSPPPIFVITQTFVMWIHEVSIAISIETVKHGMHVIACSKALTSKTKTEVLPTGSLSGQERGSNMARPATLFNVGTSRAYSSCPWMILERLTLANIKSHQVCFHEESMKILGYVRSIKSLTLQEVKDIFFWIPIKAEGAYLESSVEEHDFSCLGEAFTGCWFGSARVYLFEYFLQKIISLKLPGPFL